jgi:hypothetical protein
VAVSLSLVHLLALPHTQTSGSFSLPSLAAKGGWAPMEFGVQRDPHREV